MTSHCREVFLISFFGCYTDLRNEKPERPPPDYICINYSNIFMINFFI